MCLLIVLRGMDDRFPVVVASNRDEQRDRASSPPGLTLGAHRKMLSPKDKRTGGTWMGINEQGMFAGLTNVAGFDGGKRASSRGELPHLALDRGTVTSACDAVQRQVRAHEGSETHYAGFQLVVADADHIEIVRCDHRGIERLSWTESALVVSNDHRPGALTLPGLSPSVLEAAAPERLLDRLAPLLLDTGSTSGHRILKVGDESYGTVSSGLLAVPRPAPQGDLRDLVWRFASGAPDTTSYRNYGNLGRRLIDGA